MARLLAIDNYDSFIYNLVQMFHRYDLTIDVFRNDGITVEQARELAPDYILISPGPRDPAYAGISIPLIQSFYQQIPILGVCLGMQCINEAFGGRTVRAPLPFHGKTSQVNHKAGDLFVDIPSSFNAMRYHSLAVNPNDTLEITATCNDGVIMGMSHRVFPLHGVQFHPESFLTGYGFMLIENFLRLGLLGNVRSGRWHADMAIIGDAN